MSATITRTALDVVLDEINKLREEHGLGPALDEIPCGEPGKPYECPVAQALGQGALVTMTRFWLYGNGDDGDNGGHALAPALQEFVTAFDNDDYPELVE